ncbi:unnamed protein product [Trifolium pratense]|uniref:Uncharacterized protein n=1 Tax=Trifolium pratense TaxID=57577 RepID=A0ACB0JKZ6_TRIPR|nr:unnamed protein product [Trifolium pratense]
MKLVFCRIRERYVVFHQTKTQKLPGTKKTTTINPSPPPINRTKKNKQRQEEADRTRNRKRKEKKVAANPTNHCEFGRATTVSPSHDSGRPPPRSLSLTQANLLSRGHSLTLTRSPAVLFCVFMFLCFCFGSENGVVFSWIYSSLL